MGILFVDGVAHFIDVRLAQYPLRILLTNRTLHAWWRRFRLQLFTDVHIFFSSFRGILNGTALLFAARIFLASFCRAVREAIAVAPRAVHHKSWRTAYSRVVCLVGCRVSSREAHIHATSAAA